jgi:hypothetical protein
MWTAAFNSTDNQSARVRLVERQTADLRERLAELQERRQELLAERNATNVSEAAYKAKIGRLVGRINALQAAINATAVRAEAVGANVETVTSLRTDARNLTGPEISSVARNLSGVGLGNAQGGPPAEVGNFSGNGNGLSDAENQTPGASNGTAGPPNGTVAPSNETTESGNGTTEPANETAGPPDGAGNGTTNESQRGLPPAVTAVSPAASVLPGSTADISISNTGLVASVSEVVEARTDAFSHSLVIA